MRIHMKPIKNAYRHVWMIEMLPRNTEGQKMKRSITILSIADTSLITSTVLTGGISIAALASGVALPVGIALGGTSLLFSVITPAT